MVLKSNSLKKLISKFIENEVLGKSLVAFIIKIIGYLLGSVFLILVARNSESEAWGVFALCLVLFNTCIFYKEPSALALISNKINE